MLHTGDKRIAVYGSSSVIRRSWKRDYACVEQKPSFTKFAGANVWMIKLNVFGPV